MRASFKSEFGRPVFLTWRLRESVPHAGVAPLIVETLHANADTLGQYTLHAYAVMPSRLDLLITPVFPLSALALSLREATSKRAAAALRLEACTLWYDVGHEGEVAHLVRSDFEFGQIWLEIENGPVRAGLVPRASDYPWSSAAAVPVLGAA